MSDEYKTLPCPFCGRRGWIDTDKLADGTEHVFYTVGCHTANCHGASFPRFGVPFRKLPEAVEHWNRRSAHAELERLRAMRDRLALLLGHWRDDLPVLALAELEALLGTEGES